MDPTILSPAMSKAVGQTEFFMAKDLREGKLRIQTC